MPFFSIIIPVYNVAPYLHECLDSVLTQTFGDWEALCVDDGSTDGSGDILDEYATKDQRFRVVHQKNTGVSAARNAALDAAQGEWLCFLDSDDKVECHWLEDIAEGAKKHPEVGWIRTSYREWVKGKEPEPWPASSPNKLSEGLQTGHGNVLVWNAMSTNGTLWLNILKRSFVHHTRFQTDLTHCEDVCFIVDCIQSSNPRLLLTIPNDDYRYRMRDSSASHTMDFVNVTDALMALLARWNRGRGNWGVFTPAINRFLSRSRHSDVQATRRTAKRFQLFLWHALASGFFSPFRLNGQKKIIKWILFMLSGRPRMLFGRYRRPPLNP